LSRGLVKAQIYPRKIRIILALCGAEKSILTLNFMQSEQKNLQFRKRDMFFTVTNLRDSILKMFKMAATAGRDNNAVP